MSQKQFDFSKPDAGIGSAPVRPSPSRPAPKLTEVPGKPGFYTDDKGQLTYEPNQNPNHYPKGSK